MSIGFNIPSLLKGYEKFEKMVDASMEGAQTLCTLDSDTREILSKLFPQSNISAFIELRNFSNEVAPISSIIDVCKSVDTLIADIKENFDKYDQSGKDSNGNN